MTNMVFSNYNAPETRTLNNENNDIANMKHTVVKNDTGSRFFQTKTLNQGRKFITGKANRSNQSSAKKD